MSIKLLAIDTTTEACSAALFNQQHIQQRYQFAPRQHTHLILPMLQSLLDEANLKLHHLDAVAFTRGPGSFTGIRIAASVVQAIAFAAALPVISVSSLQCLAQGIYREFQAKRVLVAIDARMNEIYGGSYVLGEQDIMVECSPEQLSKPNQLQLMPFSDFIGVGSGWDNYYEILSFKYKDQLQKCYLQRYPSAYDVAVIAAHLYHQGHQTISAEQALPTYLRETVALSRGLDG